MRLLAKLFSKKSKEKPEEEATVFVKEETVTTLEKLKISVNDLQLGMTITELDRPWTELPVMFQELTLKDNDEIKLIKEHCQHVYIDKVSFKNQKTEIVASLKKDKLYDDPAKQPAEEIRKQLDTHMPVAIETFDKSKKYIHSLLDDIQNDSSLDLSASKELVAKCVSSILENPSAMFWLAKIKHQSEYAAEHCLRAGIISIAFGRHLQLPEKELQLLGLCGMLHDVGKMRIPTSILDKESALTPKEFETIKEHTSLGYFYLREHGEIEEEVYNAAYNHHERPDGKGYPRGIDASELSLYDKVVSIIDSYDAMTSNRCYRKGLQPSKVLSHMYKNRGTQYDEYLLKEFIQLIGIYPIGSLVELNSGFFAVVIAVSPDHKLEPVVELIADPAKKILQRKTAINLALHKEFNGQVLTIKRSVPDKELNIDMENFIRQEYQS